MDYASLDKNFLEQLFYIKNAVRGPQVTFNGEFQYLISENRFLFQNTSKTNPIKFGVAPLVFFSRSHFLSFLKGLCFQNYL